MQHTILNILQYLIIRLYIKNQKNKPKDSKESLAVVIVYFTIILSKLKI